MGRGDCRVGVGAFWERARVMIYLQQAVTAGEALPPNSGSNEGCREASR